MSMDLETTLLIGPGRSIRLDEVAVHQDAAARENLVAASIDVGNRLLATEVMQGPGRNDGTGLLRQRSRPRLIHQISFGQLHARHVAANRLPRYVEEHLGEIETL